MANNFSRTLRALRADSLTGWAIRALLAASLLAIWASWFFLGRITLWAVSDSAQTEAERTVSSVETPVGGRVSAVHMTSGQRVEKGDVLVELEAVQQEGERGTLAAELETLLAQRRDLEGQIESERRGRDLWVEVSQAKVNEARARVDEAESAAELARTDEARTRGLFDQDLAPRGDLDRAVSEREQKEAQAEFARAAALRAESERTAERADRDARIERLEGDLVVLSQEVLTQQTEIATLERQVGMRQIPAPISGTLARVTLLSVGNVIDAGDEVAAILPSGGIVAVARYKPADAVGRVSVGQQARLRLDAFPSTQFGTIPATVAVVDRQETEGRIRVQLELDADRPSNIELEHGMPGRVEIEVDRVSPASLLMRAVGRLLDQPASERSAHLTGAGSAG